MTKLILYISIILSFSTINYNVAYAQDQDIVQMDSVLNLLLKNNERLDSIFKDCELHYTVIKMEINKNNKVTSVTSLNPISEGFLNIFKPLEKMNFPKLKKAKQTIMFVYVVYPNWNCKRPVDAPDKTTLNTFLPEIASVLVKQMKSNPKTVYYESIGYAYQGKIIKK